MTSLSGHGGDNVHKNGTTAEKSANSAPINDQKIVADKLVEETANIQKTLQKTEATVHKASDGVVQIGVASADPAPSETENNKQSEGLPTSDKGEPPAQKAYQSETVHPASKVDEGTDDKSVDADDELAQIRKELASSEPAKVSEEEPAKSMGEIEPTDQAPREEAVEKENANEVEADEPMEVDEKHEGKLDSKNENSETKTATSEKESVSNENSLSEMMETGKDKADQSAVDSVLKEDGPNSKAESDDSAGKSDSEVDSKGPACKSDDEKPESEKKDKSDVTKSDEDVPALNARDAQSPANAGEKDAVMVDKNKEAGTGVDTKESEEENEEEDGEERVPLLERPPETSGRRARKTVERFSEGGTPDSKRSSLPLEQGRGAKLADCPVVNGHIGSGPSEQVHALHQVVFGRQGRPHEFRRNLRQFSGFSFRPDDAGYTKKRDSLLRYRLDALRSLSHLLNLETKNKSREDLAQGVLDFLVEPTPADTVVESAKKRAMKMPRKGARSSSRRGAAASVSEEEEEEEDDEGEDNEEQDDDEEEDEEEEEEQVKKTASRKAPKRTPAKKTPAKKTPAKRTPAKKTPAKRTPAKKPPPKKTPAKTAGRKTPARQTSKRKTMEDASASEEEEEAAPPTSKRAKTGRAPPRARH